mmetsp:Transcript_26434/g.79878  ORF Transcript_26434/g.79878 Transcript_26434/m.79878 type:complete len:96 (-) Transcript_26434:98-385(-)
MPSPLEGAFLLHSYRLAPPPEASEEEASLPLVLRLDAAQNVSWSPPKPAAAVAAEAEGAASGAANGAASEATGGDGGTHSPLAASQAGAHPAPTQ